MHIILYMYYMYMLLTHCRMAGLGKEDKKHSLFKDEKELKVAIKYMIENGECLTVEVLISAFEEMYNGTCRYNTGYLEANLKCPDYQCVLIFYYNRYSNRRHSCSNRITLVQIEAYVECYSCLFCPIQPCQ